MLQIWFHPNSSCKLLPPWAIVSNLKKILNFISDSTKLKMFTSIKSAPSLKLLSIWIRKKKLFRYKVSQQINMISERNILTWKVCTCLFVRGLNTCAKSLTWSLFTATRMNCLWYYVGPVNNSLFSHNAYDLFFCGCLVPEIKARFYLATFAQVFTIYLEQESIDWQKDLEEQF